MRKILITMLLLVGLQAVAQDFGDLRIAILGDSNVWLGGDSCDNHRGWTAWMKDALNPAWCMSYSRSGASWTNTANTKLNTEQYTEILDDDNVIFNQVMRLKRDYEQGRIEAPDLILIGCGGNDVWFAHKRPGVFDVTPDSAFADQEAYIIDRPVNQVCSLAEAVRFNCEWLRSVFPEAQIVLITPHQMRNIKPADMRKTCDIIEQSAAWMGIGVIRIDKEGPSSHTQEIVTRTNTYDGIHTSPLGAKKTGRYIARRLGSMLQY